MRNNSADQVLHKNVFLRCVVECVKEKLSRTALIYICDIWYMWYSNYISVRSNCNVLCYKRCNTMFYYIFSSEIPSFIHCIKVISFTGCYFHSVKISKVLFHSVKITIYCDVMSCIACSLRFKETCSKSKENVINRKFIGLTLNMDWFYSKSCLLPEINSTFNVKSLNILHTSFF